MTNDFTSDYYDRIRKAHRELYEADKEFVSLAKKAFGVMMNRRWTAIPGIEGGWHVAASTVMDNPYEHDGKGDVGPVYNHPFTALVEADKWYKKNVEGEAHANK